MSFHCNNSERAALFDRLQANTIDSLAEPSVAGRLNSTADELRTLIERAIPLNCRDDVVTLPDDYETSDEIGLLTLLPTDGQVIDVTHLQKPTPSSQEALYMYFASIADNPEELVSITDTAFRTEVALYPHTDEAMAMYGSVLRTALNFRKAPHLHYSRPFIATHAVLAEVSGSTAALAVGHEGQHHLFTTDVALNRRSLIPTLDTPAVDTENESSANFVGYELARDYIHSLDLPSKEDLADRIRPLTFPQAYSEIKTMAAAAVGTPDMMACIATLAAASITEAWRNGERPSHKEVLAYNYFGFRNTYSA